MISSPDDYAAARDLLLARSKGTFAASLALPERVRKPATVIYAFVRGAFDDVERDPDPLVVSRTRDRVLAAYAKKPHAAPIDRAFADVVFALAVPRAVFDALLEGLAWDAEGRRYATFEGLLDYCIRISGAIGVCMSILMDRREREVLARACDLGVAFALTRIARDVGDDARAGRLYLPIEWLEEARVDVDAWLTRPSATPEIRKVVERVASAAETYYRRADPGIAALPFDCRPAVRAARYAHSALGDELERLGFDAISKRAHVPLAQKGRLLVRALRPSRSEERDLHQTPTRGAAFLLDAVAGAP